MPLPTRNSSFNMAVNAPAMSEFVASVSAGFGTPSRASSFKSVQQSPTSVKDVDHGLSGFGGDEVYEPRRGVKPSLSFEMKRAVESLEYSEVDLELLADDNRQFEVLKASLRKKGAVTNEVLKQKLPLYLKYKKDRFAKAHPEVAEAMRQLPARTRSTGRAPQVTNVERQSARKPVNRVLSAREQEQVEEATGGGSSVVAPVAVLGRILRPGARKATPKRSSSLSSPAVAGGRQTPKRNTTASGVELYRTMTA